MGVLIAALNGLLWIMMALFAVLWVLFLVRSVSLLRLRRRLSGEGPETFENSELVAQAKVRVIVVFFAAFGLMVATVLLMLAVSALEST